MREPPAARSCRAPTLGPTIPPAHRDRKGSWRRSIATYERPGWIGRG